MPAYTFTFPAAAGGLPVSITDASGDEVATDTLGVADEVQGPIVLRTTTLPAGTYAARAVDTKTFADFRAPGVLDVPASLAHQSSAYGVVAAYGLTAELTASDSLFPEWTYLAELGDFLEVDPEDEGGNRLIVNAPGVYQIALSAATPNVVSAPGEFLVKMSFGGTGDPGYAQPVARVVYTDRVAQGSTSRILVVPDGSTISFTPWISAMTDCEIGWFEVQVTKIA